MEKLPTRRDFLGGILLTAVAAGTGCSLDNEEKRDKDQVQFPAQIATPVVEIRRNRLEEEILGYRESLGFSGLSSEYLEAKLRANRDWGRDRIGFQNNFPIFLRSYGVFGGYLRDKLLSRSAPFLVHGGEVNPAPRSYNWITGRKVVQLAESVGQEFWSTPSAKGWNIQGLLGHEYSHATFPDWLVEDYPFDVYQKVEHGKLRMLVQVEKVQGNLAENNPNWKTNYSLPLELGARIAREYIVDRTKVADLTELKEAIERSVLQTSQVLNLKKDSIFFNQKNSLIFGRFLLKELKDKNIELDPDTQKQRKQLFAEGLGEVYAEMFRAILTDPAMIQNNQEILSGSAEILNTLRGDKVSIEQIRKDTQTIPLEIHQLWEDERKKYPDIPEKTFNNPIEERVEKVYRSIFNTGVRGLPGDLRVATNDLGIVSDYVEALQKVWWRYPELSELDPKKNRGQFDPNLHLWEINQIGEVSHPILIINFLNTRFSSTRTEPLWPDYKQRFKDGTNILQKFISSNAF